MDHDDHVQLIRKGVPAPGGCWADFGSGEGAFTLALAELIGAEGKIYSIDRSAGALREQERAMRARFTGIPVHYLTADFTKPLDLPPLDGIVMANALHFVQPSQQVGLVERARKYLKPGGRMIVVEYNVDRGNVWVPHPLSFGRWQEIAAEAGFGVTELLATRPSSFLREFYAAASL